MSQTATKTPVKPQMLRSNRPIENNKWVRIGALILLGFFAGRMSDNTPAPTPAMPPAVVAPVAPPVVQQVAPVVQPTIIERVIERPTVTVMKPSETLIIQKTYPNRTIILDSPAQVMIDR